MDNKLHIDKELNQVMSIKYHGALDDDPPLTRETSLINEFEVLGGIDPNGSMSKEDGSNTLTVIRASLM